MVRVRDVEGGDVIGYHVCSQSSLRRDHSGVRVFDCGKSGRGAPVETVTCKAITDTVATRAATSHPQVGPTMGHRVRHSAWERGRFVVRGKPVHGWQRDWGAERLLEGQRVWVGGDTG